MVAIAQELILTTESLSHLRKVFKDKGMKSMHSDCHDAIQAILSMYNRMNEHFKEPFALTEKEKGESHESENFI
jgi:hypothetical protein